MTYEEIVSKVRDAVKDLDLSSAPEHAAFQFNITGEGEGAFYVEVNNGQINVEPYEYFDRDILVYTSAADLIDVLEGRNDIVNANLSGKITAEGDLRKAEFLKNLGKAKAAKAPAKNAVAKKPAAKKTTAKKAPAKKTTKK
ncbi:MAG: SCP2 sterol-binding domain-containing protein [Butyrivibrio sp.]|nr:SCP2 sterol-binding domain-containing protein [Butyrivibrio sp.]